jgi:hypothetical protein
MSSLTDRYGVKPNDPASFVAAGVLMVTVAGMVHNGLAW